MRDAPKVGDPNTLFTIERRVYFGRWKRIWCFLMGRCPYTMEKYTNCEITGISISRDGDRHLITYDLHVPRQIDNILIAPNLRIPGKDGDLREQS